MPEPPRISAVGDWGPAIFQEINDSLQDSKSIAAPPQDNEANEGSRPNPHLSDSSSVYSVANAAMRRASKQLPGDRKSLPEALAPATVNSTQKSTFAAEESPRENYASNYQPAPQPHSKDGSRAGSGTNSHHHTKEVGDSYDSYWRQSRDGQAPASSRPSRESSQAPGTSEEMGISSTHGPVNGRGEMGKERRPGQLEVKVATIEEVPKPMASPLIGKAI